MASSRIKKTVTKLNINEQKSDFAFWQTQPYETRLATLEEIRHEYNAWKDQKASSRNMITSQDFKEFIQTLNENHVRYLIAGGYAVALHGHPRYTKDLAVWVWLDEQNAKKLIQALDQFGFGSLGLTAEDFLEADQIIQLGYPPHRIDILTTLKGVEFESCYASRVEVIIDNTLANFIDLDNLKRNKKATGRWQDLADLENLE